MTASIAAYDAAAAAYQQAWRDRRPLDAARKFGALAGRGARVIDVACGPVLDVRLLRDAGLRVVAGDRSHESMRVGRTFFPRGALARWDFRRLPFGDGTFDGVWAPGALQHLPRAQIRPALAELVRVQRQGPIFTTFRQGAEELEPIDDPPAGTVYATTVSAEQLKALLLAAGYVEVEVEPRPDPLGRADVTWLYGWGRYPPQASGS
ncbi:MAG: class I SAM-dependent methyltransferase [Egibacteraceae bacterium]